MIFWLFFGKLQKMFGAEEGIRTLDLRLGKALFYHWTTSAHLMCREPESNWRHLRFQRSALPTELSRRTINVIHLIVVLSSLYNKIRQEYVKRLYICKIVIQQLILYISISNTKIVFLFKRIMMYIQTVTERFVFRDEYFCILLW